MKYPQLAARIDEAADRLTRRVLDEMYANPFWHERFGERADRHGKADGRFHVDYLIQALHADDATVMERYARWLQPVLTSRGMCTRHLDDNFTLLAAAIRAEAWPDAEVAIAMLDAARRGLHYPPGTARDLQRATQAIATQAADALYTQYPHWLTRWGDAGRARCVDDLDYHVCYAADAIALAQPVVFARHVVWLAGFFERRDIPRAHLVASLEVILAAAPTIAPTAADELRRVVEPAVAAIIHAG